MSNYYSCSTCSKVQTLLVNHKMDVKMAEELLVAIEHQANIQNLEKIGGN